MLFYVKMDENMNTQLDIDDLNQALNDVKTNLEAIQKKDKKVKVPQALPSFFISTFQVIIGLVFLGLFFWSKSNKGSSVLLTTVFFIIGFLGLFPFVVDVFTKKEFKSLKLVGGFLVLILALSYVFLWLNVLSSYLFLAFLIISLLFFIGVIFFLIHVYIAYLKRIAQKEVRMLSIVGAVGFLLFLTQLVLSHFIILTLYIIVVGIFIKGLIDFTERFRS